MADCNFEAEALMKSVYGDLAFPAILPCADAEALRSACENIVRNAVRFTDPGTAMHVGLHRQDGGSGVTITVEDSGPGVPEEHLHKDLSTLFPCGTKYATHESIGLGLAIATRAIHLHQGSISALNRTPNGLRVEVQLPAG